MNNLSKKEINLVIQALLFGSSADIISDWTEDDQMELINIAVKIKRANLLHREDVNLDNLQITKETHCDNLAKVRLIKTYFNITEF